MSYSVLSDCVMTDFCYSLSVVVPIYNAERFIRRCACSLFEQILQDVEFIFIDDCSIDRGIDVLQDLLELYPHRKSHVRILRNKQNKGVAAVRNIGLHVSKGKYIGWVDSDDWIESDMYASLYETALNNSSDIVWCDYYNSYVGHEDRQHQECKDNPLDYLKALLTGALHGGLCFTIIRKTLFTANSVLFPVGRNVMEDRFVLIQLALHARTVSYVPKAYYHYIKFNDNSITSSWGTDLKVENAAKWNLDAIFSFLTSSDLCIDFTTEIAYAKLVFKKGYLNRADIESYEKWKHLYPEANAFVLCCPNTTLKQKILGWLITHECYLPIKLWIKLKTNI